MTLRKAPWAPTALAAVVVLALAGCGGAASAQPDEADTFVFATGKDISCLDPHVNGDMPQASLAANYLDSLVSQDKEGKIRPWLAESWEVSADGLTYTFTVRDDVYFTDGTKFTAEAVKANLDHMVDPDTQSGTAGGYLKPYESTEVINETTARVTLNRPYAAFLEVLAQPFLGIESPTALKRPQAENCISPVGTGPYKIVDYIPQSKVSLVRNEDYNSAPPFAQHQGPAHIKNLEWLIVPEDSTRYGLLRAGQVDALDLMPSVHFAEAEADKKVQLVLQDRPGNPTNLMLNTTRAPFDDIKVRKAFLHSVYVEAGIDSVYFGTVTKAGGPLASTTGFYSPEFEDAYLPDPVEADRLLDEAGWTGRDEQGYRTKDGKRLTVVLPYTPAAWPTAHAALVTQIQASAKQRGFDVRIENQDFASSSEKYNNFEYDLRAGYWNTNTADVLRIVFSTEYMKSAGFVPNGSGFSNKEFDRIVNEALATDDPDIRADLYYRAQQIVSENALQLPLYNQTSQLALRQDRFANLTLEPSLSLPYIYDVTAVNAS
ncbi:ABC transporter substrate-binding protein [Arthrobacter sp. VKM Ac-2550]|uniref:ABC transporter substrate-binding protein n=1 Tax=Crystallibacter permensis TaxID=1938888 RepID=UPI002226A0B0|nr:ABC transporter substrate-binding protein [Arthrobacter sp. VKM Ac-2550]MCW2134244.1 peptide/nickel transport system substrate-binding protein [Arthrobacter sp. VKM Ac-2550]